jgi:hypothetical protein
MKMPAVSRQTLQTLLVTVWAILVGGVRVFAWDSLREGFIDVRPLPRVARALTVIGLALVFAFVLSIFFNSALRTSGELEPLPLSSSGTGGIFVPSTVVPLAYLATILAWTFLLTGALHVMGWVRWAVFICFMLFGVPGMIAGMVQASTAGSPDMFDLITSVVALVLIGLVASLIVFPRLRLPLALEFSVMLVLVGTLFIVGLYASAASSRQGGSIDFVTGYLVPDAVTNPRQMTIPLLFLAGAEIINFGVSLTRWGTRSTERYARAWIVTALLLALLVYRWFSFIYYDVLPDVSFDQIQQWAGALLAGCVLIPIAIWRNRKPFPDRVPLKLVLGLIIAMVLPQLILFVVIILTSAFFSSQAAMENPNALTELTQVSNQLVFLSETIRDSLYLQLALAGGVTAFIAWRMKRYTVAAYGLILGWTQFVWWFMEPGRPLQEWRYQYQDMEPWLLLALTAMTIFWLARGELSPARGLALAGLAFFAWVLNFTDFLDNPLALFFGFAGIFFTAFGILWGVLTAGGKFANYTSLRFPRLNRIILYLGYTLLTLNITHWFTVTHNVEEQVFNSDITMNGLRIFGYTAAFLIFVEGGRALLKKEE